MPNILSRTLLSLAFASAAVLVRDIEQSQGSASALPIFLSVNDGKLPVYEGHSLVRARSVERASSNDAWYLPQKSQKKHKHKIKGPSKATSAPKSGGSNELASTTPPETDSSSGTSTPPRDPPAEGTPAKPKKEEIPGVLGANDGEPADRDAGIYHPFDKPYTIKKNEVFDGHGATFDLGRPCNNQAETGNSEAVFLLLEGATLKNAVIGPLQSQGIRCTEGNCIVHNVHFPDVCEDAITIKGDHTTSYISDCSFHGAVDKAIQVNGCDTVDISNCFFENVGKSVRSCGDCSNNGDNCSRIIKISGSTAKNAKTFLAVNSNYGDSGEMTDNVLQNVEKLCEDYMGVINHQGNSKDLGHCGNDIKMSGNMIE